MKIKQCKGESEQRNSRPYLTALHCDDEDGVGAWTVLIHVGRPETAPQNIIQTVLNIINGKSSFNSLHLDHACNTQCTQ